MEKYVIILQIRARYPFVFVVEATRSNTLASLWTGDELHPVGKGRRRVWLSHQCFELRA